jgi:hypothetical protein
VVQDAVDLHSGAPDGSRNGRRADSSLVEFLDAFAIKPTLAAHVDALSFRALDALTLRSLMKRRSI